MHEAFYFLAYEQDKLQAERNLIKNKAK